MAFKRSRTDFFTQKVTVNVPNEKGGYDVNDFMGKFQRTESTELDELRSNKPEDLVRKKLIGWQMTDSDSKQDVPFSSEELETLMLIPTFCMGVWTAFWNGVNGQKLKN